jgi:hypothetical protein
MAFAAFWIDRTGGSTATCTLADFAQPIAMGQLKAVNVR